MSLVTIFLRNEIINFTYNPMHFERNRRHANESFLFLNWMVRALKDRVLVEKGRALIQPYCREGS